MPSTCARSISSASNSAATSPAMSAVENGIRASPDRPMPRLSKTMHSKLSSSGARKSRPQARCVALIPWISSSGSPLPARS